MMNRLPRLSAPCLPGCLKPAWTEYSTGLKVHCSTDMPSLDSISEELLSQILSNLSQVGCVTACRVSRTLHRICQPLLYRHIQINQRCRSKNPDVIVAMLVGTLQRDAHLTPHVRSMTLRGQEPLQFLQSIALDDKFFLPALSSLVLAEARPLSVGVLKKLLSVAPSLEDLECHIEQDAEPDDGSSPFLDCLQLRQTLETVKLTLRSLKISISLITFVALEVDAGGSFEEGDAWGIKGVLGSFEQFQQLETLEVPVAMLFGWYADTDVGLAKLLPPAAKQVILRHDLGTCFEYQWNGEACLRKLRRSHPDLMAATGLTRLTIDFEGNTMLSSSLEPENVTELKAMYRSAGVSLRFDRVVPLSGIA